MGKTDILTDDEKRKLPDGATYHLIDVGRSAREHPVLFGKILRQLADDFTNGIYPVHPLTVFRFEQLAEAMNLMRDARHIGKIVLSRVSPLSSGLPGEEASCLITGGMGGIGLLTAEWAAEKGIRHLILMGRHEPSTEARQRIKALRERSITVSVQCGDVSSRDDLQRVLDDIKKNHPPLRFVFHCAGLLSDGVLSQQRWSAFETVFAPKIYGGFNLHDMTRECDLDCFLLFSSIASIITPAAQANHAAACSYLDALARYRRSRGLPAISINWGPWGEIGSATDDQAMKRIQAQGMDHFPPALGIEILERVLEKNPVQIGAVSMDWNRFADRFPERQAPTFFAPLLKHVTSRKDMGVKEKTPSKTSIIEALRSATPVRRLSMLTDHISLILKRSLDIRSDMAVDIDRPLSELGLDSLLAIEIRNRLMESFEQSAALPTTILFDYPTIRELSRFLDRELFQNQDVSTRGDKPDAMIEAIDGLSDEEAEMLLMKELSLHDEEHTE